MDLLMLNNGKQLTVAVKRVCGSEINNKLYHSVRMGMVLLDNIIPKTSKTKKLLISFTQTSCNFLCMRAKKNANTSLIPAKPP